MEDTRDIGDVEDMEGTRDTGDMEDTQDKGDMERMCCIRCNRKIQTEINQYSFKILCPCYG